MASIQSRFPNCTHIMVVDFEATCGPGVSKTDAEIIEVDSYWFRSQQKPLYSYYPHFIVM